MEIPPISRLLHSDNILARKNGREVHEVGGLMRLLHSFTKRLLQSDDFLAREGGTNDNPAALFPTDPGALLPPMVYAKRARSRLCLSPGTRQCIDRIAPLAHRAPSPSAGRSQKEAVVAEREPALPLRLREVFEFG